MNIHTPTEKPISHRNSTDGIDLQRQLLAELKEAKNQTQAGQTELGVLANLWSSRKDNPVAWSVGPEPYLFLADRFLKLGVASAAREVAQAARNHSELLDAGETRYPWSDLVPLRILLARAHSECRNPEAAQSLLIPLSEEILAHPPDVPTLPPELIEEILGNLGRTHKDQSETAPTQEERKRCLEQARRYYAEAYRRTARYWTGINVATLTLLGGDAESARQIAVEVREACQTDLDRKRAADSEADCYWELATLGEAALVLNEPQIAGDYYQQAFAAAPRKYGQLRSTRRHARWLLQHLQLETSLLERWLPMPKVVVFAGHMVDHPQRTVPRLPMPVLTDVKSAIVGWLTEHNARFGFSSGACGSDLIFQEAIRGLGGEAYILLPFDKHAFEKSSVAWPGDPDAADWIARFHSACQQATLCAPNSPSPFPHPSMDFQFTNEVLLGMAHLLADEYEVALEGLCVWDGKPGDGAGGTADAVTIWQKFGIPVHRVDIASVRPGTPLTATPLECHLPAPDEAVRISWPEGNSIGVRALLFGDAKGFSKLTNHQSLNFLEHFLRPIGELLRGRYADGNEVRNTWGDGLFLAFRSIRDAGCCALDIADLVRERQTQGAWRELGLPDELTIRIALHCGPVFTVTDPVTQLPTCFGTHVSRAARLEPSTPPGEVYASQTFAALAAAQRVTEFRCDFVKQLDWAKDYGVYPTYVVRRAQ